MKIIGDYNLDGLVYWSPGLSYWMPCMVNPSSLDPSLHTGKITGWTVTQMWDNISTTIDMDIQGVSFVGSGEQTILILHDSLAIGRKPGIIEIESPGGLALLTADEEPQYAWAPKPKRQRQAKPKKKPYGRRSLDRPLKFRHRPQPPKQERTQRFAVELT